MKKTVWTFGLISGAILGVMMLVTTPFQDAIGDMGEVIGYTTMVLSFLLVYFGVRSYRDSVGAGTVGFGRAFAVGALIVGVASVCYVATWELVYYKLSPDFATKYEAKMIANAKASGASQAAIDQKVADAHKFMEMYKNPVLNVAFTFLEPLPVGLMIALISAGILRKKRDRRSGVLATARS